MTFCKFFNEHFYQNIKIMGWEEVYNNINKNIERNIIKFYGQKKKKE